MASEHTQRVLTIPEVTVVYDRFYLEERKNNRPQSLYTFKTCVKKLLFVVSRVRDVCKMICPTHAPYEQC